MTFFGSSGVFSASNSAYLKLSCSLGVGNADQFLEAVV